MPGMHAAPSRVMTRVWQVSRPFAISSSSFSQRVTLQASRPLPTPLDPRTTQLAERRLLRRLQLLTRRCQVRDDGDAENPGTENAGLLMDGRVCLPNKTGYCSTIV